MKLLLTALFTMGLFFGGLAMPVNAVAVSHENKITKKNEPNIMELDVKSERGLSLVHALR